MCSCDIEFNFISKTIKPKTKSAKIYSLYHANLEIIFMQTNFFDNLKFRFCKILSCRKNLEMFEIFLPKNKQT